MLLSRQHFIQNYQLLLFGTIAYVGVIFMLLSVVQIGNDFEPHDLEVFRGFLIAFVGVFGILYVGYSFPAFRSKESSINYLMVPGSTFEKFLFELISRIGIMLLLLPLLYWITFHLQGYFIGIFTERVFQPVGFKYMADLEFTGIDDFAWLSTMIVSGALFGFVLAFTGAAMFTKQPLVKTLFSIAVIIMFYVGFTYIAIEPLGVGKYNPTDSMWLIPANSVASFQFFSVALILANLVMLFVAFRKLKEREI
jgi:hypothetical protein